MVGRWDVVCVEGGGRGRERAGKERGDGAAQQEPRRERKEPGRRRGEAIIFMNLARAGGNMEWPLTMMRAEEATAMVMVDVFD